MIRSWYIWAMWFRLLNQASLTGESAPVRKTAGNTVFAGTVVEEGEITVLVRKAGGSSRYEKIAAMIEESEKLKSGLESKAEHLADKLVPYTLAGTALTWLFTRNVTKALSVLMVDFSCALKLAMPVSVLSAIREAGSFKITVKGGKFLEAVAEADTIVFDKTGTLTEAKPIVAKVISFNGYSEDELLRIAACLEERQNVPVVVCFNKSDIAEPQEAARLQEIYENCGCQVLFTSVKEQAGTEQIRELLKDKTTVVAGPSGVGKSSMINFLYPKAEMMVGEISQKIDRGKHTTRHSELFSIGDNTYLMDTPGFSSLYLTDFETEDLKEYFAEFRKYEPYCRFQGCMHLSEPDCGVKEALAEGKISSIRYESYKELYEELKQKRRY